MTQAKTDLKPSTIQAKISKFFHACKATIFIAIFIIQEIIFAHKFFLHTLFRASVADILPPIKLKIGYHNKLQFKLILLIRFFLKDRSWGQQWYAKVQNSILENLKQQNIDRSQHLDWVCATGRTSSWGFPKRQPLGNPRTPLGQLTMTLPIVKAEEISAQEFWQKYAKNSTPVIIKGGVKHTYAYQNWTAEMFGDRFRDFEVNILEDNSLESRKGRLKEVIDSREEEHKLSCYSFKIFSSYPELYKEIDAQNFREYTEKKWSIFLGTQLLLSTYKSTGSRMHCEDLNTLFLQIKGEKQWTLIHPDYMWLMYPISEIHRGTSSFNKNDDEQNLERHFPLYQYCPKYEFILEPGDILFNPTWFWHEVDNLQDETIAVALRWISFGVKRTNTFFDLFQLLSPKVWQQQFSGLTKRPDRSNFLDSFG